MTDAPRDFLLADILDIRIEQARLLKDNARRSALIVFFIVANTSVILATLGFAYKAGVWLAVASAMIGVTVIYANSVPNAEITRKTVGRYLRGHTMISGATGIVWGAFAIWALDPGSQISLFILSILLVSITLGGLLPGSIYRPGYIALCGAAILPFATYLIVFADMPLQLIGLGFYVYFGVATLASVQNEVNIRDSISSRLTRSATEEIARKNVEIEALVADKSRFVAAISHDLSQPLAAQRHFLEQLLAMPVSPEQKAVLMNFKAAQHNQERLIQDLVDFNLVQPSSPPRLQTIALDEAIKTVAREFEGVASVQQIRFEQNLAGDDIHTDPKLLSRIVRNLLSNAMKFTPAGGTVRLLARRHEDHVVIDVEDTGPGIPADQHAQIFDEYVQLEAEGGRKDSSAADGSGDAPAHGIGLGLAIVKKLAAQLDIDLSMASELGVGTRFSLALPPAADQVQAIETAKAVATLQKCRLLIVSDPQVAITTSVTSHLSQGGHRVFHAEALGEAMAVLDRVQLDFDALIFLPFSTEAGRLERAISDLRDELNSDIPALVLLVQPVQPVTPQQSVQPEAPLKIAMPDVTVMTETTVAAALRRVDTALTAIGRVSDGFDTAGTQ